VIGAGAWGLPAAAELAGRGHQVSLVDRYGVANWLSSSPGPTRLWRLTHPDAVRVRLGLRSVAAMERLAQRSGTEVFLRRGLLWRDGHALPDVLGALAGEGVPYQEVEPGDVGRFLPGLVPNGHPAVWVDEAGPVLAEASMAAQAGLFTRAGGELVIGRQVRSVSTGPSGLRVGFDDDASDLDADVVVLAPGPGAAPLLATLGIDLPLAPRLEQVVHLGSAENPGAADGFGCLVDAAPRRSDGSKVPGLGLYAMPTPGVGYKVGVDGYRPYVEGDRDRTPDPALTERVLAWARASLTSVAANALDVTVCSITDSPDRRFVIDRLPGGVVVACGDSGEGFKFSALMGQVLADLAEGATPDPDVASFGLARFAVPAAG